MADQRQDPFNCTDLGNSERLVAWHGADLRHVPAWGWLCWTGHVWEVSDKRATELAKLTVRRIYGAAEGEPNEQRRRALIQHAALSEARHRIGAMLALAESAPEIRAEPADFDRDGLLLNVRNGTINLATGELQPHRREDLISKLIEIDYVPGATSKVWDSFLATVTAGKDGLADFLRRAAGYTATGMTSEDAIFVTHGPGSTGKTTFVETIKSALGPYGGAIRIEVLTTSMASSGGHNEDIARLVGRRMVTAVEASEAERLREGQVKHMTGGDTIPASLKHRPAFEYAPVLKLWLATNEVPYVRADDTGMWRRLHKLPFENPHAKSQLKDQLKRPQHLTAVLAWIVAGALEWQRVGLQVPECVGVATDQLRRHMDGGFEQFLGEHCRLGREWDWTATRDLRGTYTKWAERMAIPLARRISDQALGKALRRRGCEPELRRPDTGYQPMPGWWGIAVLDCKGCKGCRACSGFFTHTRVREEKPGKGVTGLTALTERVNGTDRQRAESTEPELGLSDGGEVEI